MADYQETPSTTDSFSRIMIGAIDEGKLARQFSTLFQSFFGANGGFTKFSPDASVFEMDITRANKKYLAPMIPRNMIGQTIGSLEDKNEGVRMTNFARTFPLVEEVSSIHNSRLDKRIPGEGSYDAGKGLMTKQRRMQYYASQLVDEQLARTGRLYEYLAAQSILTGTMPAILGGGSDVTYDWRRLSTHTVNKTSAKWTTVGTDILGDLDLAYDLISDNSFHTADFVLCGEDVISGIFQNTQILANADIRRVYNVSMGAIEPPPKLARLIANGAAYRGWVDTDKGRRFHLLVTDKKYHTAAGVHTNYMPETSVLIGASDAQCDRLFGPAEIQNLLTREREDMEELLGVDLVTPSGFGTVDISRPFVPEAVTVSAYRSVDKKSTNIVTQSAPVFIPTAVNAFVLYENCA